MGLIQTSGKQQVDNSGGTSTTFNAGTNFTAGNTVIISLVHYGGGGTSRITAITVSGTSAVKDAENSDAGTVNHVEIWRATNVAGGNTQVAITHPGSSYITCSFEEWDNFTATPFDQSGTTGSTVSTAPSATTAGATAQADEVSYAAFVDGSGTNWTSSTPPTGYTETWEEFNGTAHEAGSGAYKVLSATTTETATFTTGASMTWLAVIATYKLSAGSATLDQYGFRWRLDDGSETTATWAAAQNAAP
jgi:hypothetical protein